MNNHSRQVMCNPNVSRASVRDRGIAMLIVLVVIAMATVLGTAFLAAQTTTTGITRNLENQAVARQIAESGLILMRNKIQSDDTWRTGRTQGTWVLNQTLGQGTFTAEITDADGDPSNNPNDPFVLTVTGKYGDVTHVVRSRVQPYVSEGQAGLKVEYFVSGKSLSKLKDVNWDASPDYTETVPNVNRENGGPTVPSYPGGPTGDWGSKYSGFIEIPTSGLWTFYTESDDGSDLTIDKKTVVDNDGLHGWRSKSATVSLDKGRYPFETRLFEHGGWHGVIAYWQGPGVSKEVIPASAFFQSGGDGDGTSGSGDTQTTVSVKNVIQMWGNSRLDSYKSNKGVYSATNKAEDARVSTNGIIPTLGVSMANNAVIAGKLMVRPLLPILPVVTWGNSEITQGVGYMSGAVDIPDEDMPSDLPSNSGNVSIWSGNPAPITTDVRYSSFNVGGSVQVTIQGDVTVYCTGDFQMGGTSQLIIPSGSSLKLYVAGSLKTNTSARINTATDKPGRLEIFMTGNNKDVQLNDSVQLSAIVKNPKGSLKMYGSSEFFGKYTGETLTMSGSPQLHADQSTGDESDDSKTGTTYVFAWDEGL